MNPKNLLIVSYYFPPFSRVGGRRWAKFAKYLYRNGWEINVVAGDFPNSKSPWDKDISEYQTKIQRVRLKRIPVPYFKENLPGNALQKIRWKISQWCYEHFTKNQYRGDYTDPSYLDGPAFVGAVKQILEKNPSCKTVLVSVGPYYYAADVLKLKQLFPQVRFILDYRDPWLISQSLSAGQQQNLKELIRSTNQLADAFLTVNDDLNQQLVSAYSKPAFTVPHGFDEDDFSGLVAEKADPNKIQFVYGGDLYFGAEQRLSLISNLLGALSEKGFEANAIFYIDRRKHPLQTWPHIAFKDSVSLHSFFEAGIKADFLFIIRSDAFSNLFSTKVFELIRLHRPIIVADKKGPLTAFIEREKLGISLSHESEIEKVANYVIELKQSGLFASDYNLSAHSFSHITAQLETTLLKSDG